MLEVEKQNALDRRDTMGTLVVESFRASWDGIGARNYSLRIDPIPSRAGH